MTVLVEDQNIISILGIESLPQERKLAILNQATELIQKRLLVRLVQSVPADKQNTLLALLEKQDQAALQMFVSENSPKFQEWVSEEAGKLKKELADLIAKEGK